ncbi:cysteine-rich repeat secretory protein 38-like [Rhodamnia argentea]|uniref:Cysteine-rich repeat secretory protein 38-like n=1 Tax=Rhodamnia argentea TaxID=178133 RepID=A0ABM3H6K6_9MYRT|nr:cysteine-rich repeat secretory protein 38-like [Rhodamnia argentea]
MSRAQESGHDNLASSTKKQGFGSSSFGDGKGQVFGQALCGPDPDGSACGDYIGIASQEIISKCNKADVDIWYDYCQISYSYSNFSSTMTYFGKYHDSNNREKNVSNPNEMNTILKKLMIGLISEATSVPSMFAGGESKLSS